MRNDLIILIVVILYMICFSILIKILTLTFNYLTLDSISQISEYIIEKNYINIHTLHIACHMTS